MGFSACTLRPPQVALRVAGPTRTLADFSCYFANVSGEGTIPTYQPDSADTAAKAACLGLSTMSPLVSADVMQGSGVTLSIVAGRNRTIKIFAVSTSDPAGCAGRTYFPDFRDSGAGVELYELGSVTTSLFFDTRVPLRVDFDTLRKVDLAAACGISTPSNSATNLPRITQTSITLPLGDDYQFTPEGGSGTGYVFQGSISILANGLYRRPWRAGIDTITVTDSAGRESSPATIMLPSTAVQVGASGASSTLASHTFLVDSNADVHLFGTTTGDLGATGGGATGGTDLFYLRLLPNGRLSYLGQTGISSAFAMSPGASAINPVGQRVYLSGKSIHGTTTETRLTLVKAATATLPPARIDITGAPLSGAGVSYTAPALVSSVKFDGLGNVYVGGTSSDSLGASPFLGAITPGTGGKYAFIAKYDANNTRIWLSAIGAGNLTNTSLVDFEVVTDNSNDVQIYFTGNTDGTIGGGAPPPDQNAFYGVMDGNGTVLRQTQKAATNGEVAVSRLLYQAGAAHFHLVGTTKPGLAGVTNNIGTHNSTASINTWLARVRASDLDARIADISGGGTSMTYPAPYGFHIGGTGDIYLTGSTDGTVYSPPSAGAREGYVLKLDAAFGIELAGGSQFGGGAGTQTIPSSLFVAPNGTAYAYGDTVGGDLTKLNGNLAGTYTFLGGMAAGNTIAFVAVATFGIGNTFSAVKLGMSDASVADALNASDGVNHMLHVVDDDIYILGTAGGTANLSGGATFVGEHGTIDGFVAKFSKAGATRWITQFGAGPVTPTGLVVRGSDVFVSGSAGGAFPSRKVYGSGTGTGNDNAFILKLDALTGAQQ